MPHKRLPCPTCSGLREATAKQCGKCAYKTRAQERSSDPRNHCVCGSPKERRAKRCRACMLAEKPSVRLQVDRDRQKTKIEMNALHKKYDESLRTIERQQRELSAIDGLVTKGIETFKIEPKHGSGTSEATAVIVASDWHFEERVKPGTVSGLNEHNLTIAHARAKRFFQGALRLARLLQQDVKVDTLVLALLGDFVSSDIHEEFPENNELPPMKAIEEVQGVLASGIEFLLAHTKASLVFPCHSGNHARTTRTTRFSEENGHSIEWLMYKHLEAYFRKEPRTQFVIPEGPHSYLDIYDQRLRFHHGHMIKYQGGIGGIFIPTYKAIAQWNKARKADLDVFGHFHSCRDGGNFICNGSSIGYNAFALSIKADYEAPKQQMFLIDKRRGRTCTWPILVG